MRYLAGILACSVIIIGYLFLGLALGWKQGGGVIPMAFLFVSVGMTWAIITKSPSASSPAAPPVIATHTKDQTKNASLIITPTKNTRNTMYYIICIVSLVVATAIFLASYGWFEFVKYSKTLPSATTPENDATPAKVVAPKVSFCGLNTQGYKVVYIIDHSGSMVDTINPIDEKVVTLCDHTVTSIQSLLPSQSFAVIMFAEHCTILGPDQLLEATHENIVHLKEKIYQVRASGFNDGLLDPYVNAFQTAFQMDPDAIFFVTDGSFDPQLMGILDQLNAKRKTIINTLAIQNQNPSYLEQLRKIAQDHGGQYKFIRREDLNPK